MLKILLYQEVPDIMLRKYNPGGLIMGKGDSWKSVRHTLSPTFSALKMKAVRFLLIVGKDLFHILFLQMAPIIVSSVEGLVEVFQGHADTNESFDFFRCRRLSQIGVVTYLLKHDHTI